MDAQQERQRQFVQLENDPAYRCCCGAMSAVQGATILAITSLLINCFYTLLSFVFLLLLPYDIVTVYQILIAIFVLVGNSKRNPDLYLASLVLQAIYLVPALLAVVGGLIYWPYSDGNSLVGLFVLFLLVITAVYGFYFEVVRKAYAYMKAEKRWLEENPAPASIYTVTYTTNAAINTSAPMQNASAPPFNAAGNFGAKNL